MVNTASQIDLYIDGQFVSSLSGQTFATINPTTEETITQVALAQTEDVDRAVKAARRAFDEGPWPRMRTEDRARRILKIADLLESRAPSLAELETLDTGIPISLTRTRHLSRAVANFRYFGEEAKRIMGEAIPMDDAYLNIILREPIGVAGLITPWNVPLGLASMKTAAALACGNTCILKPAEQTPLTAAALCEIAQEADLPPGVLNVIQGPGNPTGQSLVSHPGVDLIAFTGGTATGRRIMESAAGGVKRLGCELGGKSANIIYADADFAAAVDGALLGIFSNNGESCLAGSRILVERPIYPRFVEQFVARANHIRVGDPFSPDTEMGPLVTRVHYHRVNEYIQTGVNEGAVLQCGGNRPDDLTKGYFIRPAVFVDVSNRMRIAQEEIFGPVAVVMPFDGDDEAVQIANDTSYGLAGYVWSQNGSCAMNTARRLRAGTVWINTPMVRDIRAPFGGYKESGFGRDGGKHSIDFFTEVKTMCLALNPPPFTKLGSMES
jgi:5-carboxymethyl-2-hydroxymuconic-semialdehyde dehydrogenase